MELPHPDIIGSETSPAKAQDDGGEDGSPQISAFRNKDSADANGRQAPSNEFFLTQNMPGLG